MICFASFDCKIRSNWKWFDVGNNYSFKTTWKLQPIYTVIRFCVSGTWLWYWILGLGGQKSVTRRLRDSTGVQTNLTSSPPKWRNIPLKYCSVLHWPKPLAEVFTLILTCGAHRQWAAVLWKSPVKAGTTDSRVARTICSCAGEFTTSKKNK